MTKSPLRSTCCAFLTLVFASTGFAQAVASGSETTVATAQNLPAAGGTSKSATHQVESETGYATGGGQMSSAGFRFQGGAVFTDGSFVFPPLSRPLIFGVSGGLGDKNGGVTETVFGMNFNESLSFLTTVEVDGVLANNTTVVSNTVVTMETPAGLDTLSNPKAATDVRVENLWGDSTAEQGYVYLPALSTNDVPRQGCFWQLNLSLPPNSLFVLFFGQSSPGFGVPIPPIEGSVEVILNPIQFTNVEFSASGSFPFPFPIPDDPIVVGYPMEFQALSITQVFPLQASFTNRLLAVIEG